MPLTAGAVARLVHGELIGRGDVELVGVAPLDRAGPGELAFLASSRHLSYLRGSGAGAVLMTPEFRALAAGPATRIVVPDAHRALRAVMAAMYPEPSPVWGLHPSARVGRGTRWEGRIAVGPQATIGAGVLLGADCVVAGGAVVGDGVRLGSRCRVSEHAVLHAGTAVGDRVVIHAGARVGGEGFRFTPSGNGSERLPHVGRCVLGDDVEVGANTTIDRGAIEDTVLEADVHLDNQIQIGHNVFIGAHTAMAGCAAVAGSARIGRYCLIGGGAGVLGHLEICDRVVITAMSLVSSTIREPGEYSSGTGLMDNRSWRRNAARFKQLDALARRITGRPDT